MLFDVVIFFGLTGVILGAVLLLRSGMRGQLSRPRPQVRPGAVPKLPAADVAPAALGVPARVTSDPSVPAPPGVDHSDVLQASRVQAVLLRRRFPPRPGALGHWGGVPLVPHGFTWPFLQMPDGTDRALTFVLQLDCADVPERGRLGTFPDRGQLYVFLDLSWGHHRPWTVRYEDGDPAALTPAQVPASLPRAYRDRASWGWPQHDRDWPRLLPEWSIEPVLLTADDMGPADTGPDAVDESDERQFWPGPLVLEEGLARVDGAIVSPHAYRNTYDDQGALVRPYAGYPHDWQAVRIAMGNISDRHLQDYLGRGSLTREQAAAYGANLLDWVRYWSARAADAPPWAALSQEDSDAVWRFILDFQPVTLFALGKAVNESVEATLGGNPDAASVLPADALELVRVRHALASRGDTGLHIADTERMLCPPSYVQGVAAERIGQWLLLLEMSTDPQIGHHWGEGVYQFWIMPEDLAARRFDRVELTESAY